MSRRPVAGSGRRPTVGPNAGAEDSARALVAILALVGSQIGLVRLFYPLADGRAGGVDVTGGVVTVVSLAALWASCRSLGQDGGVRIAGRFGYHRTSQNEYGPDAVPLGQGLMSLAVVPLLLVAPVAVPLFLSARIPNAGNMLPLIVPAVVSFAGACVGRHRLVAVVAPTWLLVAGTWFWLPKPVPEVLGLVLAVGSVGWLGAWIRHRSRHPRARLPFRWSRRRGRRSGRSGYADGDRRERRVAGLQVDYDERRWIALPGPGESDDPPDRRKWAERTAEARYAGAGDDAETGGVKVLTDVLARWAQRLPGRYDADGVVEVVMLHHPKVGEAPMPVYVHLWPVAGPRDEALRGLVRADDPDAIESPVVERFEARHLGPGLRAMAHFALQDRPDVDGHGLYAVLSYGWRVEERGVDVRVWCSTPDLGRLTLAVEEVDELVDGVRLGPSADELREGQAAPSSSRP